MTTKKSQDQLYLSLGLSSTASQSEIKKAYRNLAKIHHPDKGGDPDTFREIEHAYSILSDKEKRKAYDRGEDPDTIASKADRVKEIVIGVFQRTISDRFVADHEDLISRMDAECNERRLNCRKAIESYESQLRNYRVIYENIKKGEIIKAHLKREITAMEASIDGYNSDMLDLNEASNVIAKFEYSHVEDTELIGAIEHERERTNS